MRPLIGTSWKMNLTSAEADDWFRGVLPLVESLDDRDLFVLPPFTSIWLARERLRTTPVRWGAQDVSPHDWGAYTGDISAPMLADLGCSFVEVGHSERRRDHGETPELIAAKAAAALRWGMRPVICIGEQARGAKVLMGGRIGDTIEFYYLDTEPTLKFVLESGSGHAIDLTPVRTYPPS